MLMISGAPRFEAHAVDSRQDAPSSTREIATRADRVREGSFMSEGPLLRHALSERIGDDAEIASERRAKPDHIDLPTDRVAPGEDRSLRVRHVAPALGREAGHRVDDPRRPRSRELP